METKKYLSLRELSQQLDIPKSTIVKYKENFPEFFTLHGDGKRKKFTDEAAEILKTIRELREERKLDWMDIRTALAEKFGPGEADADVHAALAVTPRQAAIPSAKLEHLTHLFNVLASELINVAARTQALQSRQAFQEKQVAHLSQSVDKLKSDIELVLIEIMQRDDESRRRLGASVAEIKEQFAYVNKALHGLAVSVKSISGAQTQQPPPAQLEAIAKLSEKIDGITRQSDSAQNKYQLALKENKLLKERIREIENAARRPAEEKPAKRGLFGKRR